MIPKSILEFFDDIDNPWTWDYKKQEIPKFKNTYDHADWIMYKSGWPYLPLILPGAPYSVMFKEAMEIRDVFVSHRTPINEDPERAHRGWRSICLHGEAWDRSEHWTVYKDNFEKTEKDIVFKWCNEITDICPETTRYFREEFPNHQYQRLRYMWLDPGGYIQPHTDRKENYLNPINVALNNPKGCVFKMKDKGYVPFEESGNACLVDIGNVHAVWNNSDTPRIHIISHGHSKDTLNKIVTDSLKKLLEN